MVRQADKRAHLDLQVDLLAEQELTATLHMLKALCAKLEVKVSVPDERVRAMLNETDIHKLASELDDRLPDDRELGSETFSSARLSLPTRNSPLKRSGAV